MSEPGGNTWRQDQLHHLWRRQNGRCYVCGEPAILDGNGGARNSPRSAVRFRTGSSYGAKGRTRPRVMAHRACADARSREIEMSVDIDVLNARSRRWQSEFYEAVRNGERVERAKD